MLVQLWSDCPWIQQSTSSDASDEWRTAKQCDGVPLCSYVAGGVVLTLAVVRMRTLRFDCVLFG